MSINGSIPYNEEFYKSVGSVSSLDIIVALLIDIVKPDSVVDFGCAKGAALSCFKARGVKEILGVDGHWVDENSLLIDNSEFKEHDFSKGPLTLQKQYDLAISTEVAEHLSESDAKNFVNSIVSASDVIAFSASIPGQGGENHINEQWPGYWAEKFHMHGYQAIDCLRNRIWCNPQVEFWYKQNLLLFCKKDKVSSLNLDYDIEPMHDIVHPVQYEQTLLRLFSLFNQFYIQQDYDTIIQLSFLKDYDYSAKFFLGLSYFEKQDYENSIDCLESFLLLSGLSDNTLFAAAYYTISNAFIKLANYQRAKENLEKCITIDSGYKEAATKMLLTINNFLDK